MLPSAREAGTGRSVVKPATLVVLRFAGVLDDLIGCSGGVDFDRVWRQSWVEPLGWGALATGRRLGTVRLVVPLAEVDRKLGRKEWPSITGCYA